MVRSIFYGADQGFGQNAAGFHSPHLSAGIRASDAALNNLMLGAGTGALAGLAHEGLKDPEKRKHYLKAILVGLLAGGAVGVGATALGGLPDMYKKTRKTIGSL